MLSLCSSLVATVCFFYFGQNVKGKMMKGREQKQRFLGTS